MVNFEENLYCDFGKSTKGTAGREVVLGVFDKTRANLLAVAGQQGLTINRGAESIEVTSKDVTGGWKSKLAGMKEWSIESEWVNVKNDESHSALTESFEKGEPVCVKIINLTDQKSMFGGVAFISDYSFEAPYDDAMTYTIAFDGSGALKDLTTFSDTSQMPK